MSVSWERDKVGNPILLEDGMVWASVEISGRDGYYIAFRRTNHQSQFYKSEADAKAVAQKAWAESVR